MSTGKDSKSMPGSAEFREGYDRLFGDKRPERGRWIWDEAQGKLVKAEDYQRPEIALNAPVMVDRFYEGQKVQTVDEKGRPITVDVGSRRKHREYMKENGLTTADDYNQPGGYWERAAKERKEGSEADRKDRREAIARAHYEIEERGRRR